jgi:hypothetical protein
MGYDNEAPLPSILFENKIKSPPELGDLGGFFLFILLNKLGGK